MTFKSLLLVITIFASSLSSALANTPKPGVSCIKIGITKDYKGKTYKCIKSGKKLVWNKGVVIKRAAPAVTPTPTPTPVVTPTPSATATATSSATPTVIAISPAKKTTITCVKGKTTKKVTAVNPKCPKGYKKK